MSPSFTVAVVGTALIAISWLGTGALAIGLGLIGLGLLFGALVWEMV